MKSKTDLILVLDQGVRCSEMDYSGGNGDKEVEDNVTMKRVTNSVRSVYKKKAKENV